MTPPKARQSASAAPARGDATAHLQALIAKALSLPGSQMKCLLYLACRPEAIKGAASISLADWERATGQARNTVIMALRALEDAGYLRTERAKADNGRNEISLYRLAL